MKFMTWAPRTKPSFDISLRHFTSSTLPRHGSTTTTLRRIIALKVASQESAPKHLERLFFTVYAAQFPTQSTLTKPSSLPLPREAHAAHDVCFPLDIFTFRRDKQPLLSRKRHIVGQFFVEGGLLAAHVGQQPWSSSCADHASVPSLETTPDHHHNTPHLNPWNRDPSSRIPVRILASGETSVQSVCVQDCVTAFWRPNETDS